VFEQVNRKCPELLGTRYYNSALNPHTDLIASNSLPPKFPRLEYYAQHADQGHSRQGSVAIPYVVHQRCLNKRNVRSAIWATTGL